MAGHANHCAEMASDSPPALRDTGKEGLFDLQRQLGGAGAGVPPFSSGFPAFTARSSMVQYNGRTRRSCSPSLTYVISCRDSDLN